VSAETWQSASGSVNELWESVKTTVQNVLDGDLDEVPYGDRPEVLIGAAFAVGFLAAMTLKLLARR
jgi:hypothetical protein